MSMDKPLAKDLSRFLSDEALCRSGSKLRGAHDFANREGMISLGGGLPLPSLFPWDDITCKSLAVPFSEGNEADILTAKHVITEQINKENGTHENDIPLKIALQYGPVDRRLVNFIKEHTKVIHDIGYEDWNLTVTCGNTFSWDAVLRTFTNRGDVILTEEFSFPLALETAHANGVTTVGIKMDLEGIIPEELDNQLNKWVGKRPKLLYTIPTGQNPAGSSLSAERREAIYKIVQKHDLLLVEDEPYYYLQIPEYKPGAELESLTHEQFIKKLVPSFLRYDTDGRVLRLDSFSKVLAPKSRIGWIIGSKQLIRPLDHCIGNSCKGAAGFSACLANAVLQRWGQSGYIDWLIKLRETYTIKRNVSSSAIIEYLPKGVYEFCHPVAGMFFWIKLDARKHRRFSELGRSPKQVEYQVYLDGVKNNVLLVPGQWFRAEQNTVPPQPEVPKTEDELNAIYFRGTFASLPHDELIEAIKRWSDVIKADFTD